MPLSAHAHPLVRLAPEEQALLDRVRTLVAEHIGPDAERVAREDVFAWDTFRLLAPRRRDRHGLPARLGRQRRDDAAACAHHRRAGQRVQHGRIAGHRHRPVVAAHRRRRQHGAEGRAAARPGVRRPAGRLCADRARCRQRRGAAVLPLQRSGRWRRADQRAQEVHHPRQHGRCLRGRGAPRGRARRRQGLVGLCRAAATRRASRCRP